MAAGGWVWRRVPRVGAGRDVFRMPHAVVVPSFWSLLADGEGGGGALQCVRRAACGVRRAACGVRRAACGLWVWSNCSQMSALLMPGLSSKFVG